MADDPPIFSKCWEYNVAPDLRVTAVADTVNAYFLDSTNRLHGVDLAAGTKVWSSELGGDVISNLLLADDSIFVITSMTATPGVESKASLWSVSRQTGLTEWRSEISRSPSASIGSVAGNVVVVGSGGIVLAVGAAKGELIWKTAIGSDVSSAPYFDDSGAVLGIARKEVVKIGGPDGRVEIAWKAEHPVTSVALDSRARLFAGDERGNLYSLSSRGTPAWRFRNGARISRVLAHGTEYLAVSDDNFVYNISRSGDVRWKRRLPARVAGNPLVIGNTVVVSIVGAGAAYVLDLRNGKVSNRIEFKDETSLGVAGRPDGQGFVITSVRTVSYFSRGKCPAK